RSAPLSAVKVNGLSASSVSWSTFTASVPASPRATLVILLPPMLTLVLGFTVRWLLMDAPPVRLVLPATFNAPPSDVLPPTLRLLATLMLLPRPTCTWPLATVVTTLASAPTTSTASPSFFCTVWPSPAFNAKPLSMSSYSWLVNWLTLTASVALMPAATLVMVLPPALMPAVVTLGPLAMTSPVLPSATFGPTATPALLTTVSPVLTLPAVPRSMFFLSA